MSNLYNLFPHLKSLQEEDEKNTPPLDIKIGEEFSLWNKDPEKAKYSST